MSCWGDFRVNPPASAGARDASWWEEAGMRTNRLLDRPIITADLHPTIGVNIQGPSMIRVPDWIGNRLGEYYLYFAEHKGSYIRLAYADHPAGPWVVHPPGSLHLAQSRFFDRAPVALWRLRNFGQRDKLK